KNRKREWRVARRRIGEREWIEAGIAADRFAERSWRWRQRHLWAEWRDVGKAVVDHAGGLRVVKEAGAAAETRRTLAEDVVRKTNAGREISVVSANARKRHSWITRKEKSRRSVGKLLRPDARVEVADTELLGAVLDLLPWSVRLVTQAVVQGQA